MKITAKQIRAVNPTGIMTMISGCNDIVFTDGTVFKSETSHEKLILWNKLIRMGYIKTRNSQNDEFDGLCNASDNGENPFKCTIMCSNTDLNESLSY